MKHTFPSVSPFTELVDRAKRNPNEIILRDHTLGINATTTRLLCSIASLRRKLQTTLAPNALREGKNACGDRFIFMIASPGWEYVVAMLTIFSLGAGISPQAIVIRPEEIIRLCNIAKPLALLYAPAFKDKIEAIKHLRAGRSNGITAGLPFVEIRIDNLDDVESHTFSIDADYELPIDQTGSLFFTSGTSGVQKGVVHSYEALLASARERIGTWKMTGKDVILNQKPGNWMGGIFGILPALISGACLETCAGVFDPQWFWKRISQGGVSVFDVAPTGYDRLAQYFDEHIAVLTTAQRDVYLQGMIAVRVAGVSGSLLSPHTQKRWTDLRRGKPLLNLYGSTEVTLICSMRWEIPDYLDPCCVGQALPGVQIKLVEGEVRIKAPTMFSRYLSDDPTHTTKAFDSEGFFKTGDCAEKIGDSYTLLGRASVDVLHFWGMTLITSEIENALLTLPYIANAVVLPLEDEEHKQRAAAILKMEPAFREQQPDLASLRSDLSVKTGLFLFKQPTVVYWLQEGEEITLTANGKVSKKEAREKFLGERWQCKDGVEVMDLKGIEYWRMGGLC